MFKHLENFKSREIVESLRQWKSFLIPLEIIDVAKKFILWYFKEYKI